MSEEGRRPTKAHRKYTQTKRMLESNPAMAWLGNHVLGLRFDQYIRSLNSMLISLDIDIDLRDLMSIQQFGVFTKETSTTKYADEVLDGISKVSALEADEEESVLKRKREQISVAMQLRQVAKELKEIVEPMKLTNGKEKDEDQDES